MAFDACSWLLFSAVLVNQAGRVMIPAIKTSVLADPDFAPAFEQNVGAMLAVHDSAIGPEQVRDPPWAWLRRMIATWLHS